MFVAPMRFNVMGSNLPVDLPLSTLAPARLELVWGQRASEPRDVGTISHIELFHRSGTVRWSSGAANAAGEFRPRLTVPDHARVAGPSVSSIPPCLGRPVEDTPLNELEMKFV